MNARYLALVIVLLFAAVVAGCEWSKTTKPVAPEIKVEVKPVLKCDDPKPVDKIVMKTLAWTIINQQTDSGTVTWISLTPEGYQALLDNLSSIWQQSEQYKAQIRYWASCAKTVRDSDAQ